MSRDRTGTIDRAVPWAAVIVVVLLALPAGLSHPSEARPNASHATGPDSTHGAGLPDARTAGLERIGPAGTPFLNWSENASGNLSSGVVATDPGNGTLYSANTLAGTVTELNVSTGALIATQDVSRYDPGRDPISILFDGIEQILIVGMGAPPSGRTVQGQLLALNPATLAEVQLFNDSGIPGFTPVGFAYDPPTHRFFVANASDGYVGIFNATTLYSVASLRAPGDPNASGGGLADTPGSIVWQSDGTPTLQRIFATNATYSATPVEVPGSAWDAGPVASTLPNWTRVPATSLVWVAQQHGTALEGFDSVDGAAQASSTASATVTALSYDSQGLLLLAAETNGTPTSLRVQDFSVLTGDPLHAYNFTASVSVPESPGITSLQSGAVGSGLLVLGGYGQGADRELNVSNALGGLRATFGWVRTYPMAPSIQEASVWDPTLGCFVVAEEDPNELVAVDPNTRQTLWNASLPSVPATDLAIDAASGWLFLGLRGGPISVFDAQNGSVVGSIPAGPAPPSGVAVDEANGWLLAVNDSGSGTLSAWNVTTWPARSVGSLLPNASVNFSAVVTDPGWNGAWVIGNVGPGSTYAAVLSLPRFGVGASISLPFPDPLSTAAVNASGDLLLPDPLDSEVRSVLPSGAAGVRFSTNGLAFTSIALDGADGVAYLGSNLSSGLGALDLPSGEFLGTLDAGGWVTAAGLSVEAAPGVLLDAVADTGEQRYFAELPLPPPPAQVTVQSANGTVEVRWDASELALPSPILGYRVSADPAIAGLASGAGNSTNTTGLSANLTGLTNGRSYRVSVEAVDAAGTGPPSVPIDGDPLGVPYPPSIPVEEGSTASTITLEWNPPASTGGTPLSNYSVRWAKAAGGPWTTANTSATSWTLRGLPEGTSYRVEVVGYNLVGASHPSAIAVVSTAATTAGTVFGLSLGVLVGGIGAAVVVVAIAGYLVRRRSRHRATHGPDPGSDPPKAD